MLVFLHVRLDAFELIIPKTRYPCYPVVRYYLFRMDHWVVGTKKIKHLFVRCVASKAGSALIDVGLTIPIVVRLGLAPPGFFRFKCKNEIAGVGVVALPRSAAGYVVRL